MGKSEDHHLQISVSGIDGPDLFCCRRSCDAIGKAFTLRCVVLLVLSACVFLSALFWLPPFHNFRSGLDSDEAERLAAPIQASFILEKPLSLLVAHAGRLEYDIYEEIGVPNTKVSVISMQPLDPPNSTNVVFGVLPHLKSDSISLPALSLLRSSLIELVLEQLNLSLTASIFGHPSSFEVLRFPGGITVIPVQSSSIWERPQILFNFTLNNSIFQIQRNLDELKDQLKFGLDLRSYEDVYVQMTNANGSTAEPPVTVQASVLSDVGSHILLPGRLKQLAEVITGSSGKNLGLDHSVFGKVKEVVLSSYLEHSITSPPSPSPSPSPSDEVTSPAPSSFYPAVSPSYAPGPSTERHHTSPCVCRSTLSPSASPLPHAPASGNGPQPASPPPLNSPTPSATNNAPFPRHRLYLSPSLPPNAFPPDNPYPPASSEISPNSAVPPQNKPISPTSQTHPNFSPLSPAVIYGSSPPEDQGGHKASMPPMSMSSSISPSSSSHVTARPYTVIWLIGLLGFLIFHLICEPF